MTYIIHNKSIVSMKKKLQLPKITAAVDIVE